MIGSAIGLGGRQEDVLRFLNSFRIKMVEISHTRKKKNTFLDVCHCRDWNIYPKRYIYWSTTRDA